LHEDIDNAYTYLKNNYKGIKKCKYTIAEVVKSPMIMNNNIVFINIYNDICKLTIYNIILDNYIEYELDVLYNITPHDWFNIQYINNKYSVVCASDKFQGIRRYTVDK
jgi:hypothetical protein